MSRPNPHSEVTYLSPHTHRYLNIIRHRLGLAPASMRVLDFGCGSGRTIIPLLQEGFDVVGVDVSRDSINAGHELLAHHGFGDKTILFLELPDGTFPFPNASFDFVFSNMVFEHVEDRVLPTVIAEIARVTAPGGYSFHEWAPAHSIQEFHLYMPLAHWLPKNRTRYAYIRLCNELGLGAVTSSTASMTKAERARFQYDYSCKQTFYRNHDRVLTMFQNAGFDAHWVVADHPALQSRPLLRRALEQPLLRRLISEAILHTASTQLLARRLA